MKKHAIKAKQLIAVLAVIMLGLSSCSVDQLTTASTSPSTMTNPAATSSTSSVAATNTTGTAVSSETTSPLPKPTTWTLLPPVETNSPNTGYVPAFDGQTRAPGVATSASYTVTILTSDLKSPWAVTALPDGRLIVTEKAGALRIVTTDGKVSPAIGGFPQVDDRSQGGLLDVAPAPDFMASRIIYVTLAERTRHGSLTAVGRGRLSDDERQIENFEIIWRALPYYNNSMHFGSRLAFDEAGNIFVTTGERSDLATRPKAQQLDNGYGKVVYITPDGDPVSGNPFIGMAGAMPEIYSYGHRNVQGLAIHPVTGDVWISEMGPRGGDELNLIKSGGNYGWPVISYGIEYSGAPIAGARTVQEGMEQPVYYWDPVLAPAGMTFYTSGAIPEWENNLFIGGLRGQHIARIILDGDRVVAEERLLADEGQRFRDVGEGPDGALYAVTDSGRLYRIG